MSNDRRGYEGPGVNGYGYGTYPYPPGSAPMPHPPRMDNVMYAGAALQDRDQYTYMPIHPHQQHQARYHEQPDSMPSDGMRPVASNRHIRTQSHPQNGHEEVQAGMALATMGMGISSNSMQARSDTHATPPDAGAGAGAQMKKAKTDKVKKEEKDKGDAKDKEKEKDKAADGKAEVGANGQPLAKRSCAECRRLKAKCDRQFPCSNCRRRGCALVCPDGDLTCMQGKRLVLANTEQLHDRIAQLEAALFHAHRATSSEVHPLLQADFIDGGSATAKVKLEPSPSTGDVSPDQSHLTDGTSTGTGKDGASRHSSAVLRTPDHQERNRPQSARMAVESLLLGEDNANAGTKGGSEWAGVNAAPALLLGNKAPSPTDTASDRQKTIERLRSIISILPSREDARKQADRFWQSSTWFQHLLRRPEFDAIYEPAVYAPTPNNPLTPHKLACVLMVLTLDTYLDLQGPEDNPLVAEYWEGVQKCFDTRFGWAASVAGVQALGLAVFFVGFGWRGAGASNFYWLRLMTSAVQQLGLHKEPHPSLPPGEALFRRRVFWESYSIDCLISINHGQKTALAHEAIEVKYPDEDSPLPLLKYDYMTRVKSKVIDLGSRHDKGTREEMERGVEEVAEVLMHYDITSTPEPFPFVLQGKPDPPANGNPAYINVNEVTRCTTSMCHYKAMLFLFRPSLRRLIGRLRDKILKGDRSQVVFTAHEKQTVQMTYTACRSIIAVSAYLARSHEALTSRTFTVWVQTFSAAVGLAAVAIWCAPYLEEEGFAAKAYAEIKMACTMIGKHGCERAKGVLALLPILANLVEMHYPQFAKKRSASSPVVDVREGEDMLYALLGGQVQRRRHPNRSGTQTPATAPPSSNAPAHAPGPLQLQQSAAMAMQADRMMQWGTLSMPVPDIPLAPAVSASQAAASAQLIYPQFPTPMGIAHADMNYGNRVPLPGRADHVDTGQGQAWAGAMDTSLLQAQLASQSINGNSVTPPSMDISRPPSQTSQGQQPQMQALQHQPQAQQPTSQPPTMNQANANPAAVDTTDAAQLEQWYASQIQLDPMDVWTRLQTFYEPAVPLFHPAGADNNTMQTDGFGYGYGYAGVQGNNGMGMGIDLSDMQGTGSANGMGGAWSELMVGQPQMGYSTF